MGDVVPASLLPADEGTHVGDPVRPHLLLHLSVFGGFVLLGVVLWWHVWINGHPTTTLTCQCGDPSQELWFLSWTPWALLHGHSPFLSNAIFAGQGGANELVNTSWMVPSIILAPVTWLFGPIASFNVAATLAPAVSGWCFFLAARRVTTFVPAQVLGALLFGFSPFVIQNDPFGHLDFTLLFFPPLVFLLLHDLLVGHRHSPVRIGVGLAVLVVIEFFTSTEMLAMSVVVTVLTLLVAAIMAPRLAWAQRSRLTTASAVAGGIVVVVLAYPAWFILAGPRRIVGFPWANSPQLGTTASAVVDPGIKVHSSSFFDAVGGYFGGVGPNAGPFHLPSLVYFGPLLIGFLVVSVFTWYRWRLAWAVCIGALVAWLFSFGTTLGTEASAPAGLEHPWWLPWRLFSHIPLVSDILPIRFGILVTFGAAMLLAISLDRWRTIVARAVERKGWSDASGFARPFRTSIISAAVITAVGAATLVPVALTSAVPFTVVSSPPPAWFTSDAPRLPAGTVVLVVPFAGQRAMGWQAQTGLHFALAGGFGIVPSTDGRSINVSPPTSGALAALDRLSADPLSLVTTPLPSSAADVAAVRQALARWQVGVTVVTQQGIEPRYSAGFFTAVYGRAPRFRQGVWVWTGPPDATAPPIAPTVMARCNAAVTATSDPQTVPDCVLGAGASNRSGGATGAVPS